MQFINIDEALAFVTNRHNFKHGLAHFKAYMAKIGNPQDQLRVVHIAGTNGKGSVTNYLKDILVHSGYKVGTFTSPHLISHLDRIRINGNWIEETAFLKYLNHYIDDIIAWDLSMFEIDMVIMCRYFLDQQVDIAIIETGLGGRLDFTNIFKQPMVDAIVTIGFDHTDRLGDTLEKIASEKAGIIQKGAKVVIGDMPLYLKKVIMAYAKDNVIYHNEHSYHEGQVWVGKKGYSLASKAFYQRHNLAMALNIARHLQDFKIKEAGLNEALLKSNWAGRFEIMQQQPLIIIDGAHNVSGINALKLSLTSYQQRFNILFAGLKDKDPVQLVSILEDVAQEIIVTQFPFYRCLNVEAYPDKYRKFYKYEDALAYVLAQNNPLVICGSLYFISEARAYLTKIAQVV
ncbi:MAG: Mur ligase family protein [Erysipelotrichaceae bacterium]|nr:Mur ligase family protein [Erysipelotrichaceae bacterium]